MSFLIAATYKTHAAAEIALSHLHSIGINQDQLSIVLTDEARGGNFNLEVSSKAEEGIASGTTTGGVIGAALGALIASGTIVVPGLNVVATGALAGAIAGLATGATAGGIVGGLIGYGLPEYEAKMYEEDIKDGSMLIAVRAKDIPEKKRIKKVFEQTDAYNLAA